MQEKVTQWSRMLGRGPGNEYKPSPGLVAELHNTELNSTNSRMREPEERATGEEVTPISCVYADICRTGVENILCGLRPFPPIQEPGRGMGGPSSDQPRRGTIVDVEFGGGRTGQSDAAFSDAMRNYKGPLPY